MKLFRSVRHQWDQWKVGLLLLCGALLTLGLFAELSRDLPMAVGVTVLLVALYLFLMSAASAVLVLQKQSQAGASHQTGEIFFTVLNKIPLPIFVADERGRALFRNQLLAEAFPCCIADDIWTAVHPDDHGLVRMKLSDSLSTDEPFCLKMRYSIPEEVLQKNIEVTMQQIRRERDGTGRWIGILASQSLESGADQMLTQVFSAGRSNPEIIHSIEQVISHLTTIMIDCRTGMRLLTAEPVDIPRAAYSFERILQDTSGLTALVRKAQAHPQWLAAGQRPANRLN